MATQRKSIPAAIRDEVLREAGYKCANPTCRNILTLQLHHMLWVKDGGTNDATNRALWSLSRPSYAGPHSIQGNRLLERLHALNHAFTKESMDLLLFLGKPSFENIWYSSDGLLRFAGLVAAGLVEVSESQFAIGARVRGLPMSTPSTAVRLQLSDKGRALVDSWLAGDEAAYVKVLSGSTGAK